MTSSRLKDSAQVQYGINAPVGREISRLVNLNGDIADLAQCPAVDGTQPDVKRWR